MYEYDKIKLKIILKMGKPTHKISQKVKINKNEIRVLGYPRRPREMRWFKYWVWGPG